MADGKERVSKNELIRLLAAHELPKEEAIPYIVNDLAYYIINKNI